MKSGEYRPRFVRAAVSAPSCSSRYSRSPHRSYSSTAHHHDQVHERPGAQPAAALYSIINFSYEHSSSQRCSSSQPGSTAATAPASSASRRTAEPGICVRRRALPRRDRPGHRPRHRPPRPHARRPARLRPAVGPHFRVPLRRVRRPARRTPRPASRPTAAHDLVHSSWSPLWHRATRARPGLSQADLATNSEDPEGHLHRVIVEIRDAMIDPASPSTSTQTTATHSNAPRPTSSEALAVARALPVPNAEERSRDRPHRPRWRDRGDSGRRGRWAIARRLTAPVGPRNSTSPSAASSTTTEAT